MKIRIAMCSLALSLLFTAHAWAGVDKDKLVGSWAGEVTAHFHGQKKPFKVEMTFDKDGTLTVKQAGNDKSDRAKYKIDGDRIVVEEEGKAKKMHITDIKLTDKEFSGKLVPQEDETNPPVGISITFAFTRAASAAK